MTKRAVIISTVFKDGDLKKQIGGEAYSYFFVYKSIKKYLEDNCKVVEVYKPESSLEYLAKELKLDGYDVVHLAILPLQNIFISESVKTIAFPFWEFPDVPLESYHKLYKHNWQNILRNIAGTITACNFTKKTLETYNRNVCVLPVPIQEKYFNITPWRKNNVTTIKCRHENLKKIIEEKISDHGKTYYNELNKIKLDNKNKILKKELDLGLGKTNKLEISKVVYTSIFNPFDRRKNWEMILNGFIDTFRKNKEVTLILKLVVPPQNYHYAVEAIYSALNTSSKVFDCNIIIIPSFLTEDQMMSLVEATTFYINLSKAEGACLPLMDYLAAGRPSIAPKHTAMEDYFTDDIGYTVGFNVENTHIPHDPSLKIVTEWYVPDMNSFKEKLQESYKEVTNQDLLYYKKSNLAKSLMTDYAGINATNKSVRNIVESIFNYEGENVNSSLLDVSQSKIINDTDIYIECDTISEPQITGIGKVTINIIKELNKTKNIRLFSTRPSEYRLKNRPNYPYNGFEIRIPRGFIEECCPNDLESNDIVNRIYDLNVVCSDQYHKIQSRVIYPFLRPLEKNFKEEVGIFYDFTPQVTPWAHSPETIHHLSNLYAISCSLFDKIVCISKNTRHDARWLSHADPKKVTSCYLGPSQCDQSYHLCSGISEKKPGQILIVSSVEPRKNADIIFDWIDKSTELAKNTEIIWVGKKAWWTNDSYYSNILNKIEEKNIKVTFTGFISDTELCRLYSESQLSIYPSFYEGFGFPVLDSLNHNTPCLVAYNSSLKEFNLNGVIFFDATSTTSLEKAYKYYQVNKDEFVIDTNKSNEKYSWKSFCSELLS